MLFLKKHTFFQYWFTSRSFEGLNLRTQKNFAEALTLKSQSLNSIQQMKYRLEQSNVLRNSLSEITQGIQITKGDYSRHKPWYCYWLLPFVGFVMASPYAATKNSGYASKNLPMRLTYGHGSTKRRYMAGTPRDGTSFWPRKIQIISLASFSKPIGRSVSDTLPVLCEIIKTSRHTLQPLDSTLLLYKTSKICFEQLYKKLLSINKSLYASKNISLGITYGHGSTKRRSVTGTLRSVAGTLQDGTSPVLDQMRFSLPLRNIIKKAIPKLGDTSWQAKYKVKTSNIQEIDRIIGLKGKCLVTVGQPIYNENSNMRFLAAYNESLFLHRYLGKKNKRKQAELFNLRLNGPFLCSLRPIHGNIQKISTNKVPAQVDFYGTLMAPKLSVLRTKSDSSIYSTLDLSKPIKSTKAFVPAHVYKQACMHAINLLAPQPKTCKAYSRNKIVAQLKKRSYDNTMENQLQAFQTTISKKKKVFDNKQRSTGQPRGIKSSFPHTSSQTNPVDILRLKHFRLLRIMEKSELSRSSAFRNLSFLKRQNTDLLHNNFLQERQKQKRRKKKIKRWTRRRRKRKRKILRPLWITSFLAQKQTILNEVPTTVLPIRSTVSRNTHRGISYGHRLWTEIAKKEISGRYSATQRRSVAGTQSGLQKPYSSKTCFEARQKLSLDVAAYLRSFRTSRQSDPLNNKRNFINALEYDRILAEKLQKNLRYTKYCTSLKATESMVLTPGLRNVGSSFDQKLSDGRSLSKSMGLLLGQRNKIVHNEPKEEWVWLYKYISGELPCESYLTEIDELRSIWALNKLQATNQWTDWKNFYYQDFKKAITARYETWLDKKPDKRYNVNNLKKRKYKYTKNVERLRISAKLRRGTFFALCRGSNKLGLLGIQSKRFFTSEAIGETKNQHLKRFATGRATETISKTFKNLRKTTFRYRTLLTKRSIFNNNIPLSHAIVDQYSTWWNCITNSSWGWKNIQYGAPWDRKTLYIPTKLTTNEVSQSTGHANPTRIRVAYNTIFSNSNTGSSTPMISSVKTLSLLQNAAQLSMTLFLHICIFLTLVSIPELRYTVKVNCIFIYKLTNIPIKLVSTVVEPFYNSLYTLQSLVLYFVGSRRSKPGFRAIKELVRVPGTSARMPLMVVGTPKKFQQLWAPISKQEIGGRYSAVLRRFCIIQAQFERLLLKNLIAIPFKGYKFMVLGREQILDLFRDFILAIYDFFSLPENFSPNPDEMGLDILANFVYDFEEPFIELFPDIVDIQSEKYVKQFLLPFGFFGPPGVFIQQRMARVYRLFVELFYNADAENGKDEQESIILYTVWADLINKAADDFDRLAIGISSQDELRVLLLEYLLTSTFDLVQATRRSPHDGVSEHGSTKRRSVAGTLLEQSIIPKFRTNTIMNRGSLFAESNLKGHRNNFMVDQYFLHKTDETDLFFEINPPKSFSHLKAMKYYDMIQQPFGTLLCQIYSGLFRKQKAKNILLIGAKRSEKSLLVQSFAGETEMKLILDNSSRYATISQNVALGMRRLREVFETISLQTPCIFVLEDIHLIGEKRPFLLSDEDLALVRNTNLGFEQHQPFEKNQNIQLYNRHRISNFKKPYRGDNPERLPTNMLCFDLFFHSIPKTKSIVPQAPIRLRPEGSYHLEIKKQDNPHSNTLPIQHSNSFTHIKRTSTSTVQKTGGKMIQIDQNANNLKSNQLILEKSSSTLRGLEVKQNKTIQSKVSQLAEISLTNLSVKLDRITQFLVIMDNVRMNQGFIVFATTDKPHILDPALRRPGRLEETISLPTIPNILRKWENNQTQAQLLVKKRAYANKITHTPLWLLEPLRDSNSYGHRSVADTLRDGTSISIRELTRTKRLRKNQATELITTNSILVCKHLITFLNAPVLHEQKSSADFHSHSLLFGTKKTFKLELMTLFASCVAKFFYSKKRYASRNRYSVGSSRDGTSIVVNKLSVCKQSIENNSKQICNNNARFLCKTKSLDFINDPKWTFASQLIYAFIQKRAIWNKNKYVHKFINIEKGSLIYFPSAPITTLLLPAKRFENFLRAEHDFEYTTHSNLTTATNTLQEKIQLHTTQRVLKKLYRLSIKKYYKSDKITKKLKSTFPREPRNLGQSIYFSAQSTFATAGKTNHYYRNLFLKRHRNYLTNQWWNGQLTEYNIENTLMSEVDFRTCFLETQNSSLRSEHRSALEKTKTTGYLDFLIDFPDADQYYNPIQQRWFSRNLQLTKNTSEAPLGQNNWKTWFDLEKGLSSDIINHFVFETFSRTYNIFDQNRELLDHFVTKLSRKTKIQEIESIDKMRSIL
jgi:hypothetical protein